MSFKRKAQHPRRDIQEVRVDTTREYQCPHCHQIYVRSDMGRVHPEFATLLCFACALAGVPRLTLEEIQASALDAPPHPIDHAA